MLNPTDSRSTKLRAKLENAGVAAELGERRDLSLTDVEEFCLSFLEDDLQFAVPSDERLSSTRNSLRRARIDLAGLAPTLPQSIRFGIADLELSPFDLVSLVRRAEEQVKVLRG